MARNDYALDKGMSEIGVAQHPGKLELCGYFVGAGSLSLQRELARGNVLSGKYFDAVKHLGFLSSGRGDLRAERNARVTAVRAAWYTFHRFWYVACPLRMKIIMLRCLVHEAAVSGWMAAAPSRTDTNTRDSIVLSFARKLLGERACRKVKLSQPVTLVRSALPEKFSYRRLSDSSVWRLIRCVPVAIELRVRRVNWWCLIARDLRTHFHITATIFGTLSFDKRAPTSWTGVTCADILERN